MKKKPISHAERRQNEIPEAWRPQPKVKPIKDEPRPVRQTPPQRFSKAEIERLTARTAKPAPAAARIVLETLNLETNYPTAEAAVRRAEIYIEGARSRGVRAVKLIHGWGSSGTGGRIREDLRTRLPVNPHVLMMLPGEGARGYKELPQVDAELRTGNPGITIVILKPGKT